MFDASIDDAVVDPHRLNNARVRLARLAHWDSGNEEISFDRVEFAISINKLKYPSSKWRVQTLATLMTQKTTGMLLSYFYWNWARRQETKHCFKWPKRNGFNRSLLSLLYPFMLVPIFCLLPDGGC